MKGNKEDEKRFEELMKKGENVKTYPRFTNEEMYFMGKHDLMSFGEKYPGEAEYYMQELS